MNKVNVISLDLVESDTTAFKINQNEIEFKQSIGRQKLEESWQGFWEFSKSYLCC